MGLAHTVATVEVDALGPVLALREQFAEEALRRRGRHEFLKLVARLSLRGLRVVGAVAGEGHVVELRWRDEARNEFVGCDLGGTVAQGDQSLLGIHPA